VKIEHKSLIGTYEQKKAQIQGFNLMHDDFFAVVMQHKEAIEVALRILLKKKTLKVKEVRIQYAMRNIIGHSATLDVLAEDALSVLKRNYPVFSGDGLIIESMVKEIDTEYGNLRELILKKREVYGMAARILIEKVNQGSRLHYPAVGSNCKHKIRVLVTEDEIERIRMMAKKKRCSISVLLKTNALNMYESETFKVNCDDLSELNNRLRRLMKFFAAVVGNVREGFIDDGDVSNIQEILKTVIGEIEAKGDSVRIDADAIMEDVRGRISKEWM
jgi:hypothetical protein